MDKRQVVAKNGLFIVRKPGEIDGNYWHIEQCRYSQIYGHDWSKKVVVDRCFNCTIVIGPVEDLCELDICKDSKIVVFANQLKIRDC